MLWTAARGNRNGSSGRAGLSSTEKAYVGLMVRLHPTSAFQRENAWEFRKMRHGLPKTITRFPEGPPYEALDGRSVAELEVFGVRPESTMPPQLYVYPAFQGTLRRALWAVRQSSMLRSCLRRSTKPTCSSFGVSTAISQKAERCRRFTMPKPS